MLDIEVMDAMFALLRTVFKDDKRISERYKEIIKNNIEQIYVISNRSDMAHLVGYALEQAELISPENEYFTKFQEKQYLAIMRCEGMEYELERIRDAFEKNKIRFIPLKGSVIRYMYPESWMRTSSDIDVLVCRDEFDRAKSCLVNELEYKMGRESEHDHSLHSPGGVHVELHFDLLEDDRALNARETLLSVWENAHPIGDRRSEHGMSDEMFYYYHIAHLAKHIEWAGMGMRPFLDLWLINEKVEDKRLAERQELLKQSSLDVFAGLCEEISEHWFGDLRKISDTAKKLELFVLNCGTYGSMENRIIITHEAYGGTGGYIFKRIFLPYNMLAMIYPVIKKHKWLTPFFEVIRWFKLLSKGMIKKAVSEIRFSKAASNEKVSNMKSFMSEIGL